jgi:hypothetical protein
MLRALFVVMVLGGAARADCPHTGKQLAVTRGTPKIDGLLDDPVWQRACFVSDFAQQQPHFGGKPTHPVKVAVAIDDKTLYIGARMWSDGPNDVDDALTQHDDTAGAERFIVSIDPSHTRRLAYSFGVTARGVRADWIHTDDNEGMRDYSWDPVWVTEAKILPDGWSVEMAIPLSQLRLPRVPSTSWGIDFDWYIPRRNEDVFWVPVPLDRTAWASFFGDLVDLPPVRPGLNLELLPYVAVRGVLDEVNPGYPAKRALAGIEAGLDAKFRPLPGLTVNATVNPDFGQVDADPSFVNLTAYEVQLPEKRPFFVENNSILSDSPMQLFYSRRIGGLPLRLPDYDEIDLPAYTRILAAAAAGGYVESHTQIAAIAAVSDQASADALIGPARESLVVSPLTGWGIARVEHQVGASVVAATATMVERAEAGTDLAPILPQSAITGGADAILRTSDGQWQLEPNIVFSALNGTAAAITATEEDSTHYFQRPDQPHVHLDTDAHDLLGWNAGVDVARRSGMWQGYGDLYATSPGFDLNDMGALANADQIGADLGISRNVTIPTEHVFAWDVGASVSSFWNFGGIHRQNNFTLNADITLPSFWHGGISWALHPPGISDSLTRGGPLMAFGWLNTINAYASTPEGRQNQLSANATFYIGATTMTGGVASVALTTRITPALRLDLDPTLTLLDVKNQYVDTVTDAGGNLETYGARYIFGDLKRKEASVVLRATWSLSPFLVMTLYAQPFVSVGRYASLSDLATAGTGDLRPYAVTAHDPTTALRTIVDGPDAFAIPEPDYTIASLRSTAVLRWELSPGSTLYVVWQQQRGGVASAIAEPLHSASPGIVTDSAIHTIAVKLSYWFG